MKITIENKNGEVVRETEYNPASLMVGTGFGLAYGLVVRKAYILACRGGLVSSILGTMLGGIVGVCVGHTTYELLEDNLLVKKEEEENDVIDG